MKSIAALIVFAVSAFLIIATHPVSNEGANVRWFLVYEAPDGNEYVRDTLYNIGDCWDALRSIKHRRGYRCERTLIVKG